MLKNNYDSIFDFINKEEYRQIKTLGLIASENFVSDNVMKACGTILTNKYSEGYPNKRYYGGCKIIDSIEKLTVCRLKKLFNVSYVNVQPHSGSQANAAVYLSCLNPGDKILGFNISHGGHLTHGSYINFSGIFYKSFFYGVGKDGYINYDMMKKIACIVKPDLIVCGASSYSRDIDYKFFRDVSDSVNAILLADISHTSGLVATGLLNNPFPYCHIVTSTTHKTLRGPRGGVILLNDNLNFVKKNKYLYKKNVYDIFDKAVFPGIQGGPLQNIIAAKGVCFQEALSKDYLKYTIQIIKNAQILSTCLMKKKYNILTNGTDNHCILIDLHNRNITGLEAQNALEKADIICNKNLIPFDDKKPNVCSGIRLGTAGITTRGLKEDSMPFIADCIDKVLSNTKNNILIKKIKHDVNQKMKSYPLFEL